MSEAGDRSTTGRDAIALLSRFSCTQVLDYRNGDGFINVLGTFGEGGDTAPRVVMRIERTPLAKSETGHMDDLIRQGTNITPVFDNDIYSQFLMSSTASGSHDISVTLVYPATDRHIAKHTASPMRMVHETPEIYTTVTQPFIESRDPKQIEWVHRILRKEAEVDRCILDIPGDAQGFMLVKDMKWKDDDVKSLRATAFSVRRDLRSLRDLDERHLPLLRNILHSVPKEIEKQYGIDPSKIRMFVHYQPSYYHFHVHCVHLQLCSGTNSIDRAHLLNDIIENISICNDYYTSRRTLSYAITEDHALFQLLPKE